MLLDKADAFDTIDYVYVVDNDEVLKGAISIKEVHASNKDANVEEIMKKKLVFSHPLTHQEKNSLSCPLEQDKSNTSC